MQFPAAHFLSSSSAMNSTEAFDNSVSSRPRTADPISPGVRERAMSLTSHSPTFGSFDKSERRHSGGANLSPLFTYGSQMQPLPASLLQPNNRTRANTAAAGPSNQPTIPGIPPTRRSYSTNLPESHAAAQASYFGTAQQNRPAMTRAQITAASLPPLAAHSVEDPEPSPPLPSAAFSSAMPMEDDRARDSTSRPPSRTVSRSNSRTPSRASSRRTALTVGGIGADTKPMFIAASLYEFNIDKQRREAGFPYLTYVQGEIFDVCHPIQFEGGRTR
jgi:hypothetical protein